MRMIVGDMAEVEMDLEKLGGRETARRIVEAGSAAAVEELRRRTEANRHVVHGSMIGSIAPGIYHEDIDRCWQDVYPQGPDGRGIDNAKKAFVINYGYGKRRTQKTGDKFITGKPKEMSEIVRAAMEAEAERIAKERTR